MQTQGSLAQTHLAALLEAMQSERATGTLSLEQGGEQCSLFFLFGHLFHATGDLGQGEEAVVNALGWTDGNFTFDPRFANPGAGDLHLAAGSPCINSGNPNCRPSPEMGRRYCLPRRSASFSRRRPRIRDNSR